MKRRYTKRRKYGNKFGSIAKRRGRYILKGRGDYKSFFKKLWGGVKDFGKGMWGVAKPLLIDGGKQLLRAAPTILGAGDYRTQMYSKNSLAYTANVPQMHNGPNGSLRIRHRELIAQSIMNGPNPNDPDVYDGTFGIARQTTQAGAVIPIGDESGRLWLNPGIKEVFPWLSQIAQKFGYYKAHGIAFEYRSTSAVSTVSQSIGDVTFFTELDAYRPIPNGVGLANQKVAIAAQQYVNMGKPSQTFLHGIECARHLQQVSFCTVREGRPQIDVPSNKGDERLSFIGYTMIFIGGVQAQNGLVANNPRLGDIYVTYDIELFRPILNNAIALSSDENASTSVFVPKGTTQSPYFDPTAPLTNIQQPYGLWDKSGAPMTFQSNTLKCTPQYGLLLGANPYMLNPNTVNGFQFEAADTASLISVQMNWTGGVAQNVNPGRLIATGGALFLQAFDHQTAYYEGNANNNDTVLRVDFLLSIPAGSPNAGFYTVGQDMVLPCLTGGDVAADGINFELIAQHAARWWSGSVPTTNVLIF